jgi:predicted metal-dependent hydrolase
MGKQEKLAARFAGAATEGGWHPCYVEYFRLFNAQEYYAAHDVLEHIWLGADGEKYVFYKALIQFAGGFVHLQHHHRESEHRIHGKRLHPAARLFRRSAELLGEIPRSYEGLVIEEIVVMAISSAEALEISAFAINPWHPDRAPQLRGPV